MNVDHTSQTDRLGVSVVQLQISKLGWTFREQPLSDYGIDAHIEIVKDNKATGQLVALQIKSGKSWFKEQTENHVVFRGDREHLEYWREHSLPVLVILCEPEAEICYWQVVNEDTIIETPKGWKLNIPLQHTIDHSFKDAVQQLIGEIAVAPQYTILSLKDSSRPRAKRYVATVHLNQAYTNATVKTQQCYRLQCQQ